MKTFLNIGSGPGIGLATAERFAAEGYRAILTSRSREKLEGLPPN
jgi:NAD(P)-dependent dehydrogenase (short-subunit alcohol dehydrogenase family)